MSRRTQIPTHVSSPRAKLVCLYLQTHGAATVDELATALSMSKLTLYGVLRELGSRAVVRAEGDRYTLAEG